MPANRMPVPGLERLAEMQVRSARASESPVGSQVREPFLLQQSQHDPSPPLRLHAVEPNEWEAGHLARERSSGPARAAGPADPHKRSRPRAAACLQVMWPRIPVQDRPGESRARSVPPEAPPQAPLDPLPVDRSWTQARPREQNRAGRRSPLGSDVALRNSGSQADRPRSAGRPSDRRTQ